MRRALVAVRIQSRPSDGSRAPVRAPRPRVLAGEGREADLSERPAASLVPQSRCAFRSDATRRGTQQSAACWRSVPDRWVRSPTPRVESRPLEGVGGLEKARGLAGDGEWLCGLASPMTSANLCVPPHPPRNCSSERPGCCRPCGKRGGAGLGIQPAGEPYLWAFRGLGRGRAEGPARAADEHLSSGLRDSPLRRLAPPVLALLRAVSRG